MTIEMKVRDWTRTATKPYEVCGNAIEGAMDVIVKLDLIKETAMAMPRFSMAGPVARISRMPVEQAYMLCSVCGDLRRSVSDGHSPNSCL